MNFTVALSFLPISFGISQRGLFLKYLPLQEVALGPVAHALGFHCLSRPWDVTESTAASQMMKAVRHAKLSGACASSACTWYVQTGIGAGAIPCFAISICRRPPLLPLFPKLILASIDGNDQLIMMPLSTVFVLLCGNTLGCCH